MRTSRSDGAATARPIWVVVVDGVPYVRSYAGEHGAWYKHVRRDGTAELGLEGVSVDVRLAPDGGDELDARISKAYTKKYGRHWPGPTEAMLTPPVVATTLRVEPA